MKKLPVLLTALFALPLSLAAQVVVDFTPTGTSRIYDYFSNAYAQVNQTPQGMYNITTDALLGTNVNPFASGVWEDLGTILLDGTPTLSGVESFNITGATGFDFDSVIDGASAFIAGTGYTTSLSNISGSVTINDGVVTSLTFSSDIAFTFSSFPGNPYDGTLTITESSFDLFVDETENVGIAVRSAWDVDGTTAATAVPEPTSAMFLLGGALGLAAMRRRRS